MYLQGKEPIFITGADSQICPLNSFGSAEQKGEGDVGRGDFDQLINEKDFVFYPYKMFYKCERQLCISYLALELINFTKASKHGTIKSLYIYNLVTQIKTYLH